MADEEKKDVSSSLKSLDNNLDVADSVLDKIGKILKKRWGIILLLVVGYLCYWFFSMVDRELQKPVIEEVQAAPDYVYDTIFYEDGTYELEPAE